MPHPDRPARPAPPARAAGWCLVQPGNPPCPLYWLFTTAGRNFAITKALRWADDQAAKFPRGWRGYPSGVARAAKLRWLRRRGWRVARVEMREVPRGDS